MSSAPGDRTTEHAEGGPVLFAEAGAPRWPMLIGPVVGVGGLLVDRMAPGGANPLAWVVIALVLFLPIALVVRARRRLLAVRLTPDVLVQGEESVPTTRIVGTRPPDEVRGLGIRPFGNHPAVPRHLGVVIVTLDDGAVRAAWARDAEGLHAALDRLLAERSPSPAEGS